MTAGARKKLSAFLQLLKGTATRCEETKKLKWMDTDFEHYIIRLNTPKKGTGFEYVCEKDDLMFFRKRK